MVSLSLARSLSLSLSFSLSFIPNLAEVTEQTAAVTETRHRSELDFRVSGLGVRVSQQTWCLESASADVVLIISGLENSSTQRPALGRSPDNGV